MNSAKSSASRIPQAINDSATSTTRLTNFSPRNPNGSAEFLKRNEKETHPAMNVHSIHSTNCSSFHDYACIKIYVLAGLSELSQDHTQRCINQTIELFDRGEEEKVLHEREEAVRVAKETPWRPNKRLHA
ncbi:hypothetical protein WN943_010089 [Citrus x changshan-huyou]